MNQILAFLTSVPLREIALIFFSKVIEVTISTVRTILMNKGYRKLSSILSLFEILLWVFIASTVINGIQEQPLKGVVYALGFATGIYCGSLVENRLAFGKVMLQVIVSQKISAEVIQTLRDQGYGVTHMNAMGKDSEKTILMIMINRRSKEKVVSMIYAIDQKAVIFSNDSTALKGGYIQKTGLLK